MSKILGIKIGEENQNEAIGKIRRFLRSNSLHQVVTVNPEFIVAAGHDPYFARILNHAELIINDGFGLKPAAFFLRQKIGERFTGVDLTWQLAKIAANEGFSIFFLGAQPGIAKIAAQKLKQRYPKLKIAGASSANPDDDIILEEIDKSGANILLVAYGAPKQDKFIDNLKRQGKLKHLRVAVGVGGTFDYIARQIPRAPKILRSLGLEWLYRLFRQPTRARRIYNAVIVFPLLVIWSPFDHPIPKIIIQLLALPILGYLVLNLTFLYFALIFLLISQVFLPNIAPATPLWTTPLAILVALALLFFFCRWLFRTHAPDFLKAVFLTSPVGMVFVFVGLLFFHQSIVAYILDSLLALGLFYYFYRQKLPWLYFYAVIFVGTSLLILTLTGGQI